MCQNSTLLKMVIQGLLAGAVGTIVLDALQYARHVREKEDSSFFKWETAASLKSWEEAPAHAKVGKRVLEGLLQRPLGSDKARLMTNVVHWLYGTALGASYAIVVGSGRKRRLIYGLPFGLLVWSVPYVILPPTGIYKKIWEYDPSVLWKDANAHLVYGLTTAGTFKLLD